MRSPSVGQERPITLVIKAWGTSADCLISSLVAATAELPYVCASDRGFSLSSLTLPQNPRSHRACAQGSYSSSYTALSGLYLRIALGKKVTNGSTPRVSLLWSTQFHQPCCPKRYPNSFAQSVLFTLAVHGGKMASGDTQGARPHTSFQQPLCVTHS